ncbi:RhoGEF GTPase, partial [Pseudoloma neurophilia]
MAKNRKRLEALSEIYQSELLYLKDLKIWAEDFRSYLFKSETLTIEKKHALSKILFINLDNIISLHEMIIKEIERRNQIFSEKAGTKNVLFFQALAITQQNDDQNTTSKMQNNSENEKDSENLTITDELADLFADLEYHSIYAKYLDRFNLYKYYVSRLPTVEYTLDKECSENVSFAKELSYFFIQKKINLGPKHFIYRASQKLARYNILWKAVQHYEGSDVNQQGIKHLMEKLKEITIDVDRTYGNINDSYKVYRFSNELFYSEMVKRRIPLNLFQKKRTILRETDIVVKNRNIEPKLLRFILLDTVILLCDIVRQGNIELKYIINEPLPLFKYKVTDTPISAIINLPKTENEQQNHEHNDKNDNKNKLSNKKSLIDRMKTKQSSDDQLAKMHKLYLLEIGGLEIVILFFKDRNSLTLMKSIIENAINEQRKSIIDLKIRQILVNTNLRINCTATRQYQKEKIDTSEIDQTESESSSNEESEKDEKKNLFDSENMSALEQKSIQVIKKENVRKDQCTCELHEERNGQKRLFRTHVTTLHSDSEESNNEKRAAGSTDTSVQEKQDTEKSDASQNVEKDENKQDTVLQVSDEISESQKSIETENRAQKYKRRPSFFDRLFSRQKIPTRMPSLKIHRGDFASFFQHDEQLLLFGTTNGLFLKMNEEFINLYEGDITKVIYDVDNKLIIFLSDGAVLCSSFSPPQNERSNMNSLNSDTYRNEPTEELLD